MEKNSHLEKTSCPKCKSKLDAATHVEMEEIKPKPNDFTVCLYCSSMLIYEPDLSLREACEDDLKKLDTETLHALMKAQIISKMFSKEFSKKKNNLFPPIE